MKTTIKAMAQSIRSHVVKPTTGKRKQRSITRKTYTGNRRVKPRDLFNSIGIKCRAKNCLRSSQILKRSSPICPYCGSEDIWQPFSISV